MAKHMNIPDVGLPRIVVVGCGFGGLTFARKVSGKNYQVVLIDRDNYHTFQPLLYQVATSGLEPDSIAYPIREIFKGRKHFYFRMAEVKGVDEDKSLVKTDIGELNYDYLILATGAATNFFGMEDVEQHAHPMKYLTESLDLRSIILQKFEEALVESDESRRDALMNFVIVGGGPTGVELAGALAELRKHVLPTDYPDLDLNKMEIHLMEADKELLAPMSDKASKKALGFLKKMDVKVWLESTVESYDGEIVAVRDKGEVRAETLVWAAGVAGRPVDGIAVDKMAPGHRFPVDEHLRIKGKENIYAIGDVAAMITDDLPKGHPMLASVALQQGRHLAKQLLRIAKNKDPEKFQYKDKGTMATIGRNKAVADIGRSRFAGTFAWFLWMFVHLWLLVGFRNRVVVFFNWTWSYLNYTRGTRLIVRKFYGKSKTK